jgi:hypothetical protein
LLLVARLQRDEARTRTLTALIDAEHEALFAVPLDGGPAELNAAASHLLALRAGSVPAPEVALALRRLEKPDWRCERWVWPLRWGNVGAASEVTGGIRVWRMTVVTAG